MAFSFYKYQGTGNDFVIIDNRRELFFKNDTKLIKLLCDRKFGIGADGLLLLQNHPEHDFTMVYYNADGNKSSMCGNGGRCIVHFARYLGLISESATFEAVDGLHHATLQDDVVSLQMNEVRQIEAAESYTFLDTGSPHHVQWVENLSEFDVFSEGRKIRYDRYGAAGANVNFVEQLSENTVAVRTYERGVEDETLSCGTGVTAVALAAHQRGKATGNSVRLQTRGGNLTVRFKKSGNAYVDIFLEGPATLVFKGEWL